MSLTDLPEAERPREKLLASGASALSDVELLALLLRTGIKGKGVLELARSMLTQFGGVHALLNAPAGALRAIKGMGPAKYAELAAVLELAKRALNEQLKTKPVMDSPEAVKDYLRLWLANKPQEVFVALFLDTRLHLLGAEELFRGSLSHTSVHPREVARRALELNCASIIVAHNHPSGDCQPSSSDIAMTRQLMRALELIDVKVLDHFIVGRSDVKSLAALGLL